jgi:hypothetical protein
MAASLQKSVSIYVTKHASHSALNGPIRDT